MRLYIFARIFNELDFSNKLITEAIAVNYNLIYCETLPNPQVLLVVRVSNLKLISVNNVLSVT